MGAIILQQARFSPEFSRSLLRQWVVAGLCLDVDMAGIWRPGERPTQRQREIQPVYLRHVFGGGPHVFKAVIGTIGAAMQNGENRRM